MSEREGTMISRLLKHNGWLDGLDDIQRRAISGRMISILANDTSKDREKIGAVRALAILEKNDIDRAKLYLQQIMLDGNNELSPEDFAREVRQTFAAMRKEDGLNTTESKVDETKEGESSDDPAV